jgi:hypothetical protein
MPAGLAVATIQTMVSQTAPVLEKLEQEMETIH